MIYSSPKELVLTETSLIREGFFEELDKWKTHNQNHSNISFKSHALSDEEYLKIKDLMNTLYNTSEYASYKKAFEALCRFCHIVPRGVIVRRWDIKAGSDNKNYFFLEYNYNTKKMRLPEDTVLYHMSKVDGIKELNSYFRGKPPKGYLYDKPRVYFTIRRHMPKFLADYKMNEKMYIYVCKEPIKDVYVDPLVWCKMQGAVYVESNRPIKVEQLTTNMAQELLAKISKKSVQENSNEFDVEAMYNFITESGLVLCEE